MRKIDQDRKIEFQSFEHSELWISKSILMCAWRVIIGIPNALGKVESIILVILMILMILLKPEARFCRKRKRSHSIMHEAYGEG